MKYSEGKTPENYVCCKCGKKNSKLWRIYSAFLNHQELTCVDCTETEDSKMEGKGCSIGWKVASVPTEEEDTYWGYLSVPEDGCQWWYNLPLNRNELS